MRPRPRQRGFSALELLIVVIVVAVAAAVAAPMLAPSDRTARLRTATESIASRLRIAVEEAAKTGASVPLDIRTVPVPSGILVNSPSVDPPSGAYRVDSLTLQGGTGRPWAFDSNQAVVVVLSDERDPSTAQALVLTRSGQLERWRMSGSQWEELS
jgi:prepilin-type N-terminal cleavage/methylation domain-containing protein